MIALLVFLLFTVSVKSKELSGRELIDFVSKNKQLWVPKPEILNSSEVQRYGVMDVKYIQENFKIFNQMNGFVLNLIGSFCQASDDRIRSCCVVGLCPYCAFQIPEGAPTLEPKHFKMLLKVEIPESFDARQKWPKCNSIGWIRDQSNCGSCWAVAAAEVASDRMCINPPYYSMMLSSEDILSCCGRSCYQQEACQGGYPFAAMNWWMTHGIVTGTEYTDHQGCRPYSIRPCPGCRTRYAPSCEQQCQQSYPRNYTQDKYFAAKAYSVPGDVTTIQREILAHGPVEAAFTLFEDFYYFGKRIYHHTWGRPVGGHAVKIIGWGVEGRVPYWLVVNSWGKGWGDQGLFRILRGNNECGFEAGIVAALPRS